ncbi:MAG: hypothetical protein ACRC41_07030 [Sarcina sp.]
MVLPKDFTMVAISLAIGAFCAYMYHLDKKAKKMKETEEGKREYYEKYTPNYIKKRHKKLGLTPPGRPAAKEAKVRMSKKERRKAKEENN